MRNSYEFPKAVSSKWMIILVLLCFVPLSSGCEPLRKKFTRKKKTSNKHSGVDMVLEPIDYPALVDSPSRKYKHHYSMWMVWHNDLTKLLDDRSANDKRAEYIINNNLLPLQGMQVLISDEKMQKQLALIIKEVEDIRSALDEPVNFRNYPSLKRKNRFIGKDVRANFRPRDVQEMLNKAK